MPDQTPAEAAVARGMALLDAKVPGWEDRINLDLLSIDSEDKCICGQVSGDGYIVGLALLGRYDKDDQSWQDWDPIDCGFVGDQDRASWSYLTAEWKRAILARRAARLVAPDAP